MKINCIAIDDEILALNKIKRYVQKIDYLNLLFGFTNAIDSLSFLKQNHVDLIFLDIQMDELTGIEFLESLQNPPYVILTTAYDEYALKGYELNVVDYLLKPISFHRFVKGVEKVYHLIEKDLITKNIDKPSSIEKKWCFVKSGNKTIKISLDKILYIEGMKDYLAIHTISERILVLNNFSNLLSHLQSENIIRVHKSYAIAIDKIESMESNSIFINGVKIPVSKSYRQFLYNKLNNIGK